MKLSSTLPIISTLVAAAASTKVVLAPFTNEVRVGEDYLVEWLQDGADTLELWVVAKGNAKDVAWTDYENLFKHKKTVPIDGNYTWTVGDLKPGDKYGLWISGKNYADLSDWFDVLPAKQDAKEKM